MWRSIAFLPLWPPMRRHFDSALLTPSVVSANPLPSNAQRPDLARAVLWMMGALLSFSAMAGTAAA
jgi:hypothetical protein